MHRIVGVLQQIWAGFKMQFVHSDLLAPILASYHVARKAGLASKIK